MSKFIEVGRYEIAINYVQGWAEEVPEAELPEGGVSFGRITKSGGFIIGWSAKKDGRAIGFGELTVADKTEQRFECDPEAMSQEFCEAVLLALARSWTANH